MNYKTDYHIHTRYSDGKSVPEDYISPAIAAGIKEIGFSEHLVLFKEKQDWCMDPAIVSNYLDYLSCLSEKMNHITIRRGLEVDFFPGREKETGDFLDRLDLDFRIGSVHYLGNKTVDLGPEFYKGKNIDKLYEVYFERVMDAASSGLFDIIGHCDLIRIYGHKPSLNPEPLYHKLAETFWKNDVAIELNTNGRNKPLADFYPDRRFLHIFKEKNIPVCVNSDAHTPSQVGQYFDEAYELLKYVGYTEMALFNKRKREMIPL